jgi:DNA end-binding protein Ku
MVIHTLQPGAEIRGMDAVEELNSVPSKVKPEEIKLAKQVIATFDAPLNLADYKDEYREGLQQIIDAKIAGQEFVAPPIEAPPKVVNLMEALKRSLDAVGTAKKQPAKVSVAAAPKTQAKRKRA